MKQKNFDTICALATSGGTGALGLIRISGPLAHQIIKKIFHSLSVANFMPRKIYFGGIYDGERLIDEVLMHLAIAPHSFTGEDSAEISCHGSPYIEQEIMKLMIREGARPASPGEFSQRAFLNGKVDLAQAEAIADLIASENEASHRLAIQQMRGGFSQEISNLRSKLLDFTSLMELELDFSEEDVTFADRHQLLTLLTQVQTTIHALCNSFNLGNVIKNGVPTAIIGATNVGKSTLLNALLGEERAIVSDIHGTTRDTIEEELALEGIRFRFIDTAGLRKAQETIEQIGIERSYQKIRAASLLLLLLDAGHPELFREQILQAITPESAGERQIIIVVNKYDIINDNQSYYNSNVIIYNSKVINTGETIDNNIINHINDVFSETKLLPYAIVAVSAKKKLGIASLQALLASAIRSRFDSAQLPQNAIMVTNLRHLHALQEAQKALDRVREGLHSALPTDLVAQDLRQALYDLGSITGDVSTEEILGNIFSKFCIGK